MQCSKKTHQTINTIDVISSSSLAGRDYVNCVIVWW